jgi:hypothetical protein
MRIEESRNPESLFVYSKIRHYASSFSEPLSFVIRSDGNNEKRLMQDEELNYLGYW